MTDDMGGARLVLPEGAPPIGSLFAGKFRIERILGEGGMGYVLGARDESTGARVALKLLLPEHTKNRTTVARFVREVQASQRITSEHVVRVLDAGEHADTRYIVMEYLEGSDLADLLEREKVLSVQRAIDLTLQACEALAEAHAAGTIHRDLKPANLFVTRAIDGSECIKVLDFGISRTAEAEHVALTTTTAAAGTPLYMSPEQLRSMRDVDARADIWAIGVVLFELLAGQPPFVASTLAEIGAMVLAGTAPDVRSLSRSIPDGVALAIARCLRREVSERFPSLAELAAALAPFGSASAEGSRVRIARALEGVPRPAVRAFEAPNFTPKASLALAMAETMPEARTTASPWKTEAVEPPSRSRSSARTWMTVIAGFVFVSGAAFVTATQYRPTIEREPTTRTAESGPPVESAKAALDPATVAAPIDAGPLPTLPSTSRPQPRPSSKKPRVPKPAASTPTSDFTQQRFGE